MPAIVGVPKEIKDSECRVAVIPAGAQMLRAAGHAVLVQKGAGEKSGFSDAEYRKAGAKVVPSADAVWKQSGLILKVKEPQRSEYRFFSSDKILFSYLHLAAEPELTKALMKSGMAALAAETVRDPGGRLPILEPMSELAGRMAMIVGAYYQATPRGGGGILVSGLPGVLPARVAVIGGGTVGENAAKVASGMGAQITILDNRQDRLRYLEEILPENVSTLISNPANIEEAVTCADIIIGAVLIPGAKAPKLITRKILSKVKKRSVLVDVCIDQGGVSETSRPTTHSDPTYLVGNVLHYCVANMPGAYGRSATLGYSNALTPYALKLANLGLRDACDKDAGFSQGVNVLGGKVVYQPVADSLRLPYTYLKKVLPLSLI